MRLDFLVPLMKVGRETLQFVIAPFEFILECADSLGFAFLFGEQELFALFDLVLQRGGSLSQTLHLRGRLLKLGLERCAGFRKRFFALGPLFLCLLNLLGRGFPDIIQFRGQFRHVEFRCCEFALEVRHLLLGCCQSPGGFFKGGGEVCLGCFLFLFQNGQVLGDLRTFLVQSIECLKACLQLCFTILKF